MTISQQPRPTRALLEALWASIAAFMLGQALLYLLTGIGDPIAASLGALVAGELVVEALLGWQEACRDVPLERRYFPPAGYRARRFVNDIRPARDYMASTWRNLGGW